MINLHVTRGFSLYRGGGGVPSNRITPEGIHAKLNINFVVDVIKRKTFVNVKNSFFKCLSKDS